MGYFGGLIALIFTMLALAESSGGLTLNGTPPIFGLDPEMREGTRAVGPLTALWYLVMAYILIQFSPAKSSISTGTELSGQDSPSI